MTTTIGRDVYKVKELLESGELVAIPTETVYGLAGNALDENAVLKIFTAKGRPQFNPLIVHLASWADAEKYTKQIPEEANLLAQHFTPGPMTLLLPKNDCIPDLVTAGSNKVAIRIPGHALTQQLLHAIGFPLAAPSANRFGYVSPVTAQHVLDGLGGRIHYILDGGPCTVGLESTIVDFEENETIIRRTGAVTREQIEMIIGKKVLVKTSSSDHPVAPGMLKSHYATQTPLYYGDLKELCNQHSHQNLVIIGWGSPHMIAEKAGFQQQSNHSKVNIVSLSDSMNLEEAARNLFACMRKADSFGCDAVLVEKLPNHGIGQAINDRLKRAQHHFK